MIKIFKQSNSEEFTQQLINCYPPDTYGKGYVLGNSHTTVFANGELTVVLDESVRNETIVIVAQPTNYSEIFELLATIDAAKRSSAREIIAVIPSLPHSRQERRAEGIRTSISARLFADMLQVAGVNRVITMDVHTSAIEGFYNIPFDNIDSFKSFIKGLKKSKLNNHIVVSPDFGAMKRAKKYATELGLDMAFISKERLKANEVAEMTLFGDVEGKEVLIFDDMIDTGGTLVKATDLLKEKGAKGVSVIATHGIFSNGAEEKLSKNIDMVHVTNTVPIKMNNHKISRLDVSGRFHNAIQKILNKF
jgi:ribose-phosphate pyrophosphokinase